MTILMYKDINQILGDAKKRFLSYGFRLAEHHFHNVHFNLINHEASALCNIFYSGKWSQKENADHPHLTTLDGFLIALHMSENFICKLFNFSKQDLEKLWICGVHIKSGANATNHLDKISIHSKYMGTTKAKIENYFTSTFETKVSNMTIKLEIGHPIKELTARNSLYQESLENYISFCYDHLLKCFDQQVGLTIVDLDNFEIISKIKIITQKDLDSSTYNGMSSGFFPCYTLVDIFVCASQQIQALFYQLDQIDRQHSNNLWMREIKLKYDSPYKTLKDFYQLVSVNNIKRLNLRGSEWRTGTFSVTLPNLSGFELKVKVAHQLPNKKALLNDNVVYGKEICKTPVEKRADKTPQ
ncbi:AvrD family protein [Niallia sp. 01092]|uniref:AvrD family protein n=1 Tax=unclassified Niallia TaxID=2837522 RepID=UPI003FD21959